MPGCVFVFRNRKTQNGAKHGDVSMSLIFSCHQAGLDPHHYLTEVPRHEEQVKAAPARWLPWNDQEQLAESFLQRDSDHA